jgi:hypothetical protein
MLLDPMGRWIALGESNAGLKLLVIIGEDAEKLTYKATRTSWAVQGQVLLFLGQLAWRVYWDKTDYSQSTTRCGQLL